jgi:hypothetical protein
MFQKIILKIITCAAVVFVLATFTRGGVAGNYVNLPRSPNLEDGRTISFPIKGVVVYITLEEREHLVWIGWIQIGAILVVALAFIVQQVNEFRSKK